uniref:Uncharacterized protein n=1 Tax=Anguilla anguilla TaxID=7936 RepID=A0A0E9QYF7_ANGAN
MLFPAAIVVRQNFLHQE